MLTQQAPGDQDVAGIDITSGLPRVEELFEARAPKGEAIISEIDGTVEVVQGIEHDEFARGKLSATTAELLEERAAVEDLLG